MSDEVKEYRGEVLPRDFWLKEMELQAMPGRMIPDMIADLWNWVLKHGKKYEKFSSSMNGIKVTFCHVSSPILS